MLNNNYKISVIVPAYNIAKYLPRCLDSILNQTYKNLEIIVISDGSTDGTNDILRNYAEKDNRIVAIFKENSGVSDTRNRGLDIATGDYIGFVDGDDYVEPDMYEILLKNAIDNDADISHCGYQMVFPSRVDYYYNTGKKIIQNNEQGLFDLINGDFIEPGIWNKLYKKEVLDNVRMIKHIRMNEDVIFNVSAFINSKKSIYEDKALYHYILRKNSATSAKPNYHQLFDALELADLIIEKCQSYNEQIRIIALSRKVNSILVTYRKIKVNKLKEFYPDIEEYRLTLKEISNNDLSKKLMIEKILVSYFPQIYVWVYYFYNRFISKNKDKYEIK